MKILTLLLLVLIADPSEISKHNSLKLTAEKAFLDKDFAKAALKYSELYDTLNVRDPKIGLNLAHSYFELGDTSNAKLYYQGVAAEGDPKVKSIAYQQLGVIARKPETLKESLQYLKSSLKADPSNEEARYNYELVKKQIQQQEQQNQENQDQENQEDQDSEDQENQDQQSEDQESQDEQNKEGEEGEKSEEEQNSEQESESDQKDGEESEEQKQQESQEGEEEEGDQENQEPSTQQKLEDMNISEDKARMILEAMKNNEVQYIQQQRRKATKPKDTGKPDW